MTRKYTPEEKRQLIQNLDIEVEHRVRQLEEWLAVALENFRLHQEALVSRVPKLVRQVTMGEFADKYDGDVQACLRGLQSARVEPALEIDRDTRKRKWAEAESEERAAKNARMMTPKKPAKTRLPVPKSSPVKPPPISPEKQRAKPPSSATFKPTLPARAPVYPTLRAPRHDEDMVSVNGSPLANPYTLGLGWFASEEEVQKDDKVVVRSSSIPSSSSALFSIPTKDGHFLEFDPLVTSPRAFDRLVGITDSAKKQAKEEMARLVREAVRKWVIE